MALYLKYRPQSFADVVGQDHIVTTLENAAKRKQLAHAYLFSGTRGTGKTSVARILAKTILLLGAEDSAIRKHIVRGVENGSLIDFIEIDAASNRGIDEIRDLIEKVGFAPAVARTKVYIIDEVHMMTKEAFNALLKTLEEPPEYAYFILATTELHKVPETIQSRCQRFLFRRVKDDDLVRRLQYIVDQEKMTVDRDALRAIARHALGSFRDGIALLDQLRSHDHITLATVLERAGNSIGTIAEDLMAALETADGSAVLRTIAAMESSNVPPDIVAGALLEKCRSSLHKDIETAQPIDHHLRLIDALLEGLRSMRSSPLPVLHLEAALLSCCSAPSEPAPHRTPRRLTAETVVAPSTAPAKATEPPEKKPPTKSAIVHAEALTMENVRKHWAALVEKTSPPSAKMSLKSGVVTGVTENTITICFPSAFQRDKVAGTSASRSIEELLATFFHRPVRIACVLESDVRPEAPSANTNLVDAAKEVFPAL